MTNSLTDRVRQVVDTTGLTHAEFAERVGIDGPKLSKSLSGQRNFSSSELAAIAQEGRQSVDWLLTGAPSRSWQITARAEPKSLTELQASGTELISAVAERFDALEALGLHADVAALPARWPARSFAQQADALAAQAQSLLGDSISLLPTLDVIDLIEQKLGINVVLTDLPSGCDGMSYQDGPFRIIVLGTTPSFARQRFTLAHEVGHILWGDATEVIEEYAPDHAKPGADSQAEKRANRFAAMFLASDADVRAFLGSRAVDEAFNDLCWAFRMTPSAMSRRLLTLGIIDDATRARLGTRTMRSVGMALGRGASLLTRTGRSSTPRRPMLLVQRCINAYLEGEMTLQAAADLMHQDVELARALLEDDSVESVSVESVSVGA